MIVVNLINGRYHTQNRTRDTLHHLYKEGVYAENVALTEEAYDNQLFSREWLYLQRILSDPPYYMTKEHNKRKVGILIATNGITENLTKQKIAKRAGTNRQNLKRWENDLFHKEVYGIFWGDKK
ncbi:hypothetical protein EBZ38_15645 [bacterium]|nr:hypothetical protein [bacterium]